MVTPIGSRGAMEEFRKAAQMGIGFMGFGLGSPDAKKKGFIDQGLGFRLYGRAELRYKTV